MILILELSVEGRLFSIIEIIPSGVRAFPGPGVSDIIQNYTGVAVSFYFLMKFFHVH